MRRILVSIILASFALALAPAAQADRGDKWHDWKENHHGGDRHSDPPSSNIGPPSANDRDDRRDNNGSWGNGRDDDRRPWFGRREHDRAREGVMHGRMIPLEELENRIARGTPGFRIGNPELLMFDGRPVYRMRWRTPDGHILILFADAETGQVLDIHGR
jgi:uncharacterized membrane protein YkoI